MSWQARKRRVTVLADMALRQERVAQCLAELRERHGLSQERAAQKVGITHRQWQRWENGQSMPRPGNLGEVALAFGVPISWFYDEEIEIKPDPTQLDRVEEMLKQLVSGQDALAQALAALGATLDERLPTAAPRRRRAS